jgi:para-aminobenzoate synthetase component 1
MLSKKVKFLDPVLIFNQVSELFGTIFLDSNMTHEHYARYSFIAINPIHLFCADNKISLESQLLIWQALFDNNKQPYDIKLPPFTGGLAGFISYDLAHQIEFISNNKSQIVADYNLGLYSQVFAFDLYKKECYIIVNPVAGYDLDYKKQFTDLCNIYNNAYILQNIPQNINNIELPSVNFKSNFDSEEYAVATQKAINYIKEGDIFEVNLAQCFKATVAKNFPSAILYNKLRQINSAPFSAYLNFTPLVIMSASPERFISIREKHVETRPIKGTIKRSLDKAEDLQLTQNLKNSDKDHAENIMIVDLMRNDLSKICKPCSVTVSQLCEVESFTNIHHLVSVINGTLKDDASIFDIIPACFPGGSITGAPKIRAMQIIDELEPDKRGVYCGSIGYFGFNSNVDLSITIRTLIKNNNNLRFYVGGAITLDSDPEKEYLETILKGQKITEVFI